MSPAILLGLMQMVESLLVDAPEVVSLWTTIKGLITAGADPTPAQWQTLYSQMVAAHNVVQGTAVAGIAPEPPKPPLS